MTKRQAPTTKEEVLTQAIDEIRSKFGEGSIMRLGDNKAIQADVISTGILPLDVALGVGGLPRGRIVEIFGPEGTGKTTLALHAIAETQASGGIAAFIDAEHALDPRLAAALGVDVESLYLAQPDSGEQALYILETLVRSSAVDMVVVDSVAALTPQAEIDGQIGDPSVGLQARLMSYGLRRLTAAIAKSRCIVIFINQLRATISTGYARGPQETTTGGRALKFYTSVRIEVRRGKNITKGEETIGHELFIKVVKNKLAPPFRTAHASLIYGQGVPKTMAVVDMSMDANILKRKGSWVTYKGETIAQGKEKVAAYLDEHPDLKEEIKAAVLAKVSESLGFVTVSEEGDEPEEGEASGGPQIDIDEEVIELTNEE
ncbi:MULTISPECIES: recombinase RecA [Jonquetella]|uniref:Protein RecA n=1 Tax=Jonquetella anthropi DSM 22815 TaxID=885272 RepID=H0UJ18_9BACT|nr:MULTISPECIES: recombinase RecA [Jonquetella]EEX49053.1 RecA protein [Jonquetella anthropi E3_33 E1]EHM13845.1 protein RecA [Jonquetella anthropi DSM 22815]ERL23750.1 RecA protein [Jonquetella sp. BV3C21]